MDHYRQGSGRRYQVQEYNTKNVESFIDPSSLTKWTKGILYACMALVVTAICFDLSRLVASIFAPMADDTTAVSVFEMLFSVTTYLVMRIVLGVTLILFSYIVFILTLHWIYRANANARCLGASEMRFSPDWAIGWFLIPVLNLWKSYQVIKEIWKTSIDPQNWKSQKGTIMLPLYWVSVIAFVILFLVAAVESMTTVDTTTAAAWLLTDLALLSIVVLQIAIIKKIYTRQMTHRMTQMQPSVLHH